MRASAPGQERQVVEDGVKVTFRQVGWLGQSGATYDLDNGAVTSEPGSFTPLWIEVGD